MENKKAEKKVNKVLEILKKEYPFEGMLLGVLGIMVLLLGVYIFEARLLEIALTDLWIFNTPLKIQIFSIIIMLVGLVAMFIAFAPFFIPGLKEMNRVTWPTRKTMINHSSRVLGFIVFLGAVFVIYDFIFRPIFAWLIGA